MYGLWFHKPLDIRGPTRLDTGQYSEELALTLMRSKGSAYAPFMTFNLDTHMNDIGSKTGQPKVRDPCGGTALWQTSEDGGEASFLLFDLAMLNTALECTDLPMPLCCRSL